MSIYRSVIGQQRISAAYEHLLEQLPSGFEQLFVNSAQGKTFVLAVGDRQAPPLVLLHGSLSNSVTWINDMTLWAKQFRVYAIDIIGEGGKSAESRPSLASQAYSTWLMEVFQALEIRNPTLIGLSLGGWLALDFATTHPEHVAGLVLLSPAGIGPNRNILVWALPYFFLGRWGVRQVYRKILGPVAKQIDLEASELGKFLLELSNHVQPRTEILPVFSDAQLTQIRAPLLLMLGARDVTLYAGIIRDRVRKLLPHAQIRYLEQAGHLLGDQSRTIQDFLLANIKRQPHAFSV